MNIIREAGGRKDQSGMMQNALNAAFAIYSALKDALHKMKTAIFRQTLIIARVAVSVLMSAGPGR